MKALSRIGFLTVAALFMVTQNAHALQATYSVNEVGGSGLIQGSIPASTRESSNRCHSHEVLPQFAQAMYERDFGGRLHFCVFCISDNLHAGSKARIDAG